MQFPSGLLNLDGSPTPALMDAIRHSETGHLNDAQAVGAVSKKDAIGPFQFLRKNLHQMGYKMPKNISEADATDIDKSRTLAAKYVKGYNQHHKFDNPFYSLVAFNWGPTNAEKWVKEGADFNKLPKETQDYVTRASVFLNQGQNNMAVKQTGALSTNKTAQLHPDLQADVDKMIAAGATQAAVERFIKRYGPNYGPALKNQDKEFVEPALTGSQILQNYVKDNATVHDDGSVTINPALKLDRDRFSSHSNAVSANGDYSLSNAFTKPPTRQDLMEGHVIEAMAQRDANPNLDVPVEVPDGVGGALTQALAPTGQAAALTQVSPSNQAALSAAQNEPHRDFNATAPLDGSFIGDDDGQSSVFNPSMMAAGQSMQGRTQPIFSESGDTPPALTDDGPLIETEATQFDDPSDFDDGPALKESDNTSKRPDAALLKEANDQLGDINASAGRRNAAILSTMPTQAIGNVGTRPNDLIRIGAAMAGGSARGGLAGIEAAGREFGAIEDRDLTASGALQKALASGKGKGKAKDLPPPVIENPTVTSNIDALIPQLDEDLASWLPSTNAGFGGKILSAIPGSDAYDFAARLETIKANIGFDKLQAMRDASPTGGALGQVSEMELRQLNASMGNLDIGQSPEQLRENLIAVREQYIRTIRAIEAQRQGYRQMQGGGGLTQSVQNLINTYAS